VLRPLFASLYSFESFHSCVQSHLSLTVHLQGLGTFIEAKKLGTRASGCAEPSNLPLSWITTERGGGDYVIWQVPYSSSLLVFIPKRASVSPHFSRNNIITASITTVTVIAFKVPTTSTGPVSHDPDLIDLNNFLLIVQHFRFGSDVAAPPGFGMV
jgi:hypothetical protein